MTAPLAGGTLVIASHNPGKLREIAALRPSDTHALSGVWGVGSSRVARYGDEVLAVLNAV